ncbi:TPA: GNAT family N-acetyltransferase [Escherichia coli]|nr:GNAT family N-acetyltransferase [Escherichia coli]
MQIRDYQPGDFQQLCAIFIRAVTMISSQHYSPQQIAAWAQIDESRWKEKLAKSQVRVACALLKPLIKSESELTVDASITAKPFFERYGFQTVKQQRVECRGTWFTNFYMRYKPQY